jgi:hypothetical protein
MINESDGPLPRNCQLRLVRQIRQFSATLRQSRASIRQSRPGIHHSPVATLFPNEANAERMIIAIHCEFDEECSAGA